MWLNIVDINVFYSTFADVLLFNLCYVFYVFNVFLNIFLNVFASTSQTDDSAVFGFKYIGKDKS